MRTLLLLPALLLAAAGCSDHTVAEPPDTPTRDRLVEPRRFTIDEATAAAGLRVALDRGDHLDEGYVDLRLHRGEVDAVAEDDGDLTFGDLTLLLEDIAVPPEVVHGDVALTEVHLHVDKPITCHGTFWSDDGDLAYCDEVAVPLVLDWNIRIEGDTYPLASQVVTGLHLSAMVEPDGPHRLHLALTGASDGVAWSWSGGLMVFSELSVDLDGYVGTD